MDIDVGSEIGPYVLEARLGGGGFGSVWRARSRHDGRPVAIKLLTGTLSSGDNASLRAEVELLAATASNKSPHVVRVLGGGLQPLPHIVMEYIDGTDLGAQLRERGALPPRHVIRVGLGVTDALSALNEAGIIHRDVKPANVMIDRDGTVKLTDFGIAKIIGFDTITIAGQLPMTMAYAAPEAWEGAPTHLTDLYAVGILLYQCLCGAPPFSGNYGALYRHHASTPPNLDALPGDTPASLRELIRACLEKDPALRIQSARDCTALLEQAAAELAVKEPAPIEPSRFGAWLRGEPYPGLAWAWHCTHETSGDEAIVEVVSSDGLQAGDRLRQAVAASAGLAPLGAARLLGANRLVLRPGESWRVPPTGSFTFWVAYEEQAGPSHAEIDLPALGHLISQVLALNAAALDAGISLRFSPGLLHVTSDGRISLGRAGIDRSLEDPLREALATIKEWPLSDAARATIAPAADLGAASALVGAEIARERAAQHARWEAEAAAKAAETTRREAEEAARIRAAEIARREAEASALADRTAILPAAHPRFEEPRAEGRAMQTNADKRSAAPPPSLWAAAQDGGSGRGGRKRRMLLAAGGMMAVVAGGLAAAIILAPNCGGGGTAPPTPSDTVVAASSPQPSPSAPVPTMAAVAPMREGRFAHTVTRLDADDTVLVTGGAQGYTPSSSAERYDPTANSWDEGHMIVTRAGHTATLLPGQVLLAGGSVTSSAELYDITKRVGDPAAWKQTGPMLQARRGHTATLLDDGTVLVVGGDAAGTAELFHPETNTWSPAPPIPGGRRAYHTATLINHKVYIIGGTASDTGEAQPGDPVDIEVYDPGTGPGPGTWSTGGALTFPRAKHTATLLSDGSVLIVGTGGVASPPTDGNFEIAEVYRPGSGIERRVIDPAVARRTGHTAVRLNDGRVLVAGGHNPGDKAARLDAFIFDPTTASWIVAPRLNQSRNDFGAVALQRDGRVLEIGGSPGRQDVDLYLPPGVPTTPVPTFATRIPTATTTPTVTPTPTPVANSVSIRLESPRIDSRFDGFIQVRLTLSYRSDIARHVYYVICTDSPSTPKLTVSEDAPVVGNSSRNKSIPVPFAANFKGISVHMDGTASPPAIGNCD